ncbi:chorismate synthase [Blautia liquoris]|uniref:Chorismate synthase n=1 Tax=Blautia liquoris TaxID=2779518 RepID=A0A7M2RI74_9FIRM|nr:chorismate synthase [Blautia liquoris]QOV20025.1 chorismate synthase [Blautia liquoris]
MAGSTYGMIFKITTWGESHGKGIGVVIDGCPAGLLLEREDIQKFLDRRKPGQDRYSTKRREGDAVEILSGVFEGYTTGTPIALMIRNTDQRSEDYNKIADYYRPGHADYTYDEKYGFRDYRGGGRSSGRETAGRVAAGAIASKLLKELGVTLTTYVRSIGPVSIETFHPEEINRNSLNMPDAAAAERASEYLEDCLRKQDSSGGCIECIVHGLPSGVGDPVFEKLDANLAKALMSIGAVKAIEIGDGKEVSVTTGSHNNDAFVGENGEVRKKTNHAGGILGGISDGSDLILRASFKPTPSIFTTQQTVNSKGDNIEINIKGRHDPVIVPRAVVVVESMTAVTLIDSLMTGMSCRLSNLKKIWN